MEEIKKQTIKQMKELGTYKKQYAHMIAIYASLIYQYQILELQFYENGSQITEEHTNKAGATNTKKSPIYTALESLRKDIATYSDKLGLNPKSLENITQTQKATKGLEDLLKDV